MRHEPRVYEWFHVLGDRKGIALHCKRGVACYGVVLDNMVRCGVVLSSLDALASFIRSSIHNKASCSVQFSYAGVHSFIRRHPFIHLIRIAGKHS